jgi:hypothetical protein
LLLASLLVFSCADARGRFNQFQQRAAAGLDAGIIDAGIVDETYDGGPCAPPAPGSVQGPALLALDTGFSPGQPILFFGEIDTPALDGTTAVHFMYRALDAADRKTLVGDQLDEGPFPLGADGTLTADLPAEPLAQAANPLNTGVTIVSQFGLRGHICGTRTFYCGLAPGQILSPVMGTIAGRFGITLVSGIDALPARPRYGCDADAFAIPLAD